MSSNASQAGDTGASTAPAVGATTTSESSPSTASTTSAASTTSTTAPAASTTSTGLAAPTTIASLLTNTAPAVQTTAATQPNASEVTTAVVVTVTPSGASGATTLIVTSTMPLATSIASQPVQSTSTTTAAATSVQSSQPSSTGSGSGGLSAGGTIAVAVVVPVASVALIILALLFWWKRRQAKKLAEDERRKEVEEYGFNPNQDPTLPSVGGLAPYSDESNHNSGYRGWGATSNPRKVSTNLSSGGGIGMALSDNGSAPAYHSGSPSEGTVQFSDGHGRPDSGDSETIAALGTVPVAAGNRNPDIHRGPSNASSAYSANRSDGSEDIPVAGAPGAPYYDDGNSYYPDVNPQHGSHSGAPPVIRDVQARRNARIENPSVFPQQGNAGIAQNF